MDRLADLFAAAAAGSFPPADGVVEVVPGPADLDFEAVVEFTGHAVVATDLPEAEVLAQGHNAFGGIVSPGFLRWLAGPEGEVGSHDAVLVRLGTGDATLPAHVDLEHHSRVIAAHRRRRDVTVYGDARGLATVGRGLAGRWEISVELLEGTSPGQGAGRALIAAAVGHIPLDEPVFASVAPGNAASLRAFLACGFKPIGAEVVVHPVR